MFELQDLFSYSIEIDFSKYLPSKDMPKDALQSSVTQIMEKINLNTLKVKSFSGFRIALSQLEEIIPSVEFSESIKSHHVDITLFKEKKMRLNIEKTSGLAFINTTPPEKKEKKPTVFNSEDMKKIGSDFSFLFGRILGILKIEEMPTVEVRLVFKKNMKVMPSRKLQALSEDVSKILENPKANIVGLEIEFLDNKNIKHSLNFSQGEEELQFIDFLKFKPDKPIVLLDILENGLELTNGILQKISEV